MRSTRPLGGFLLLAALALVLAACGSSGGGSTNTVSSTAAAKPPVTAASFPPANSQTFAQLAHGITQNGPVLALTEQDFTPGTNRLGFGIFDATRKQITGAPVAIYVQAQTGGKVYGPYMAREESLGVSKPYLSETVAKDPDSAKFVYVTNVKFPKAGKYNVLGVVKQGEKDVPVGTGTKVSAHDPVPGVGDKPPAISTPTVKSAKGNIASIDTRTPHDDMHDVSFKDVLGKKPIVLVVATPLLCQSRVCGPVVDETEEVKHTMPEAKGVAFIHQEVYNHNNANDGYRPQLTAFHLQTEPWLFVIDKSGKISTRIEGAFSASELETAIKTAVKQ
ncbi:MAG TPA: hypothetical protein VJU60_12455 [Thermoleophilaceae bacterium]|nr:hypothetical protein [Thermoleophilaceae bacterium]